MSRTKNTGFTFASFSGVCTFLAVSLFASSSSHAHSNDPLSVEEINKTAFLTQQKPVQARVVGDVGETISRKEVLLIERYQQKNAPKGQRLAEVFTYDYDTNQLIESRVNLETLEVISTTQKQGVQLPLTKNELEQAKRIVFEDDDEREVLENEYQRITSRQLTDTSELNIKAFTFTADSLPNRVNEASKLCGIHRCAQLMLYTGENIVFEITPIVNLSKGVVTQRIGF